MPHSAGRACGCHWRSHYARPGNIFFNPWENGLEGELTKNRQTKGMLGDLLGLIGSAPDEAIAPGEKSAKKRQIKH